MGFVARKPPKIQHGSGLDLLDLYVHGKVLYDRLAPHLTVRVIYIRYTFVVSRYLNFVVSRHLNFVVLCCGLCCSVVKE